MQLAPRLQVVNGKLAYLVTITTSGSLTIKSYFDAETGMKVKQITETPEGASTAEWSNYKSVATGIKLPFTETSSGIEYEVKEVKVNSGLTAASFK